MSETNAKFITQRKEVIVILRIAIVIMVFAAWDLADTFQVLMGTFNMGVLLFLAKYAFEALRDYFDQEADGVEEQVFNPSSISNAKGIICWLDNSEEDRL